MVSASSAMRGAQRHGENAGRAGKRAISGHKLELLARAGYATRGVLYAIIGALAIQTAVGAGGGTEGSQGALATIAQQPFGKTLLVLTAIGLFGYALWRLVQGGLDVEGWGTEAKGIAKRVGAVVSGLIHIGLGVSAVRMVMGSGGGGGSSKQAWTASLLESGWGQALVGIVGIAILGAGIHQIMKAVKASFMKSLKRHEMNEKEEKLALMSGRAGLAARGVVFGMMGWFVIQAAWQRDSSEVRGFDGALATILQQPYGPWLLGLAAIGLLAFAFYSGVLAKYRRIQQPA